MTEKATKYRSCFVPLCPNNSSSAKGMIFIAVPRREKPRIMWFKAAHRDILSNNKPSLNTAYYCCQEHFNLEEDMDNFVKHKLTGCRLIPKQGTVPHIFKCQKRGATDSKPRSLSVKKARMLLYESIIDLPTSHVLTDDVQPTEGNPIDSWPNEDLPNFCKAKDNSSNTANNTSGKEIEYTSEVRDVGIYCSLKPEVRDVGIGCSLKPHFRSKSIQCSISFASIPSPSTEYSNHELPIEPTTSFQPSTSTDETLSRPSTASSYSRPSTAETISRPSSAADKNFIQSLSKNEMPTTYRDHTIYLIKSHPKRYLGIPESHFFIIKPLLENLKKLNFIVDEGKLFMVLMKIKFNDSFERLGDLFELDQSTCSKNFKQLIPVISQYFSPLIFFNEKINKFSLPMAFRANYSDVAAIIDCFEVQIQKPAKPAFQALTWSEYKKCNTLKFLVSCSPNGFVNFISKSFGGRMSDKEIVEKSGFLEKLPNGSIVMADRGFKQVDTMLHQKNCRLIRPPSVSNGEKLTEEEAIGTKKIAALRIHVERVVGRFREFAILKPHATVDLSFSGVIDDVVVIAAGLINLQPPIIKL